jgi:hypothetical protein
LLLLCFLSLDLSLVLQHQIDLSTPLSDRIGQLHNSIIAFVEKVNDEKKKQKYELLLRSCSSRFAFGRLDVSARCIRLRTHSVFVAIGWWHVVARAGALDHAAQIENKDIIHIREKKDVKGVEMTP